MSRRKNQKKNLSRSLTTTSSQSNIKRNELYMSGYATGYNAGVTEGARYVEKMRTHYISPINEAYRRLTAVLSAIFATQAAAQGEVLKEHLKQLRRDLIITKTQLEDTVGEALQHDIEVDMDAFQSSKAVIEQANLACAALIFKSDPEPLENLMRQHESYADMLVVKAALASGRKRNPARTQLFQRAAEKRATSQRSWNKIAMDLFTELQHSPDPVEQEMFNILKTKGEPGTFLKQGVRRL